MLKVNHINVAINLLRNGADSIEVEKELRLALQARDPLEFHGRNLLMFDGQNEHYGYIELTDDQLKDLDVE